MFGLNDLSYSSLCSDLTAKWLSAKSEIDPCQSLSPKAKHLTYLWCIRKTSLRVFVLFVLFFIFVFLSQVLKDAIVLQGDVVTKLD